MAGAGELPPGFGGVPGGAGGAGGGAPFDVDKIRACFLMTTRPMISFSFLAVAFRISLSLSLSLSLSIYARGLSPSFSLFSPARVQTR